MISIQLSQLRELRRKLGISQAQLAKLAGVSQSLIARLELGKVDPKLSTYSKILKALSSLSSKSRSKTAADIMHSPVIWVGSDAKLIQVIRLMESHGISQLPILEHGVQLGSVTESSILRLILENPGRDLSQLSAKSAMELPFPVIPPQTELELVAKLLEHHPAVLIQVEGKIKGIITKQDLMLGMLD